MADKLSTGIVESAISGQVRTGRASLKTLQNQFRERVVRRTDLPMLQGEGQLAQRPATAEGAGQHRLHRSSASSDRAAGQIFHAPSTTDRRPRFVGTRRPFSRQTMTLSAYSQRRLAVARLIPNRQQIPFHGVPSARAHMRAASSRSRKRFQMIASSTQVISVG